MDQVTRVNITSTRVLWSLWPPDVPREHNVTSMTSCQNCGAWILIMRKHQTNTNRETFYQRTGLQSSYMLKFKIQRQTQDLFQTKGDQKNVTIQCQVWSWTGSWTNDIWPWTVDGTVALLQCSISWFSSMCYGCLRENFLVFRKNALKHLWVKGTMSPTYSQIVPKNTYTCLYISMCVYAHVHVCEEREHDKTNGTKYKLRSEGIQEFIPASFVQVWN